MPENVQEPYANAGQRPAARRRIREYIAREQRSEYSLSYIVILILVAKSMFFNVQIIQLKVLNY